MKFAMYGSGAAGSVFASYMRKGGADIILIDRYEEHMKKVAENGMNFTIHLQENGEYRDINEVLTGFRTYTSAEAAAEAEGKVDVIIYMTKATQLEAAIKDSLPLAGENTVVCSLINGLGNDDNLLKFFPAERCIIGSGVLGTAMPAPAKPPNKNNQTPRGILRCVDTSSPLSRRMRSASLSISPQARRLALTSRRRTKYASSK